MSDVFPWREAMAFGLGKLALTPAAFWAMTPRELAAAAEGMFRRAAHPLGRGELETLMQQYPDGGDGRRNADH